MNGAKVLRLGRPVGLILTVAGLFGADLTADAQDAQHLAITQPGGMPGLPSMMAQRVTNGVSVTWFGPSGYYQLFQKLGLENGKWQPVGGLNLSNQAILPVKGDVFFRVAGPSPHYSGARNCTECHAGPHDQTMKTAHAGAFTKDLFVAQGGQTNSLCLSCHTVGFGLPTGFLSKSTTPHLAGVQCENCHGPAATHAASPDDYTLRPHADIAATVCGGCHSAKSVPPQVAASHPPLYEEWNSSAHRAVRDELKADFASSSGPTSFIPTCGRCHSGTVREAFLESTPLPDGHEAGAVGIACATCHDPHSTHVHANVLAGVQSFTNVLTGFDYVFTNNLLGPLYTNQLLEPLSSLQDYHTSGDFSTNYNPQINVCAQCHNDRGTSWVDADRPPHHSPQYNMLLGTVGELASGLPPNLPGTHSRIEKQCVSCHMPSDQGSGHNFTVTSYEACVACHGSSDSAQGLIGFVQGIINSMSQEAKAGLDQWATNHAPAEIRKYGTLAWEYQNAGQLSNPDGTLRGPVSDRNDPAKDEQKYIPANIKKARFDLYLVINDGSYGVHNFPYAFTLLGAAQNWIQTELNK